ncbi:helix-turn-helix domain-containing protein [Serratia marcescens]|uniref:helix-turn-helix domain-containing protein n=1 Tax=Serratia marcescens TaxID=615 RepID=UPI0013DCCC49|nr:helix-turn-helix transcriptional regulator [Serratia marcescens]
MLMQSERVDVLIGAPYGPRETLLDWERFGRLIGCYYPDLICLIWTSLPVRFMRMFTPAEYGGQTLFFNKRVSIPVFCQIVLQVVLGYRLKKGVRCFPRENDELPLPSLTLREVLVLTELMEGRSLRQIAGLYNNSMKTISAHKRRAMAKLGVRSNVQLLMMLHSLSDTNGSTGIKWHQ